MSPLSEMLQEDEQRQLQRYIKQHGMNRSHVRDALLSLVGEQNRIFTAEDLIALAKVRELSIGTTTIYSSIDLFVKAGILLPLPMGLSGSLVRTSLCRGKALALCRHCGAAMLYRNGPTMSELQTVTPPRYSDVTPLLLYWGSVLSVIVSDDDSATRLYRVSSPLKKIAESVSPLVQDLGWAC